MECWPNDGTNVGYPTHDDWGHDGSCSRCGHDISDEDFEVREISGLIAGVIGRWDRESAIDLAIGDSIESRRALRKNVSEVSIAEDGGFTGVVGGYHIVGRL